MEVIKVVVRGELPKSCWPCLLWDDGLCSAKNYKDVGWQDDDANTRPPWCPLASTSDLPVDLNGTGWIIDDPDSGWKDWPLPQHPQVGKLLK